MSEAGGGKGRQVAGSSPLWYGCKQSCHLCHPFHVLPVQGFIPVPGTSQACSCQLL